jgi:hypothetical protein
MCEGAVGSITKKASRRAVGPHRAFRFAASMLIEENMKEPLLPRTPKWQSYESVVLMSQLADDAMC